MYIPILHKKYYFSKILIIFIFISIVGIYFTLELLSSIHIHVDTTNIFISKFRNLIIEFCRLFITTLNH